MEVRRWLEKSAGALLIAREREATLDQVLTDLNIENLSSKRAYRKINKTEKMNPGRCRNCNAGKEGCRNSLDTSAIRRREGNRRTALGFIFFFWFGSRRKKETRAGALLNPDPIFKFEKMTHSPPPKSIS